MAAASIAAGPKRRHGWRQIIPVLGACLLWLAGCGDGQQAVPGPYLFAVVYSNHAWVTTNKGLVVTAQGDLYQFDLAESQATLPKPGLTDDTALRRYFEAARFDFVQSLDKPQLDALWRASLGVQNKTLSDAASICRDAGSFLYLVFQPAVHAQQQMVVLYQTGDFRRVQQNTAAQAAVTYLQQLAQQQQIAWLLDPAGHNWCSGL